MSRRALQVQKIQLSLEYLLWETVLPELSDITKCIEKWKIFKDSLSKDKKGLWKWKDKRESIRNRVRKNKYSIQSLNENITSTSKICNRTIYMPFLKSSTIKVPLQLPVLDVSFPKILNEFSWKCRSYLNQRNICHVDVVTFQAASDDQTRILDVF